jgi:predicted transcriptional regulator
VLSDQRLILLTVLKERGSTSIRALSRKLHRNYRNVYDDVRLLAKTGLLHQDPNKTFYVPWDKIQAEIDLAA